MEILDRVIQMQQKGKPDTEIMTQLQNEGISPTQINNAINQAKIKNAVSPPEEITQPPKMQESMMSASNTSTQQEPLASTPQPQEPVSPAPQPEAYSPQPQEQYYTPQSQSYPEQDIYMDQGGYGTETISEIAEQVATEKLEDYKSKVGDIASFKLQTQNKIQDIDDRLKRIENSIDKLQQAVLGRIGEFGENYAMIHKDLDNLHGTIAKLMNPLIDNVNEMRKISKK